MGREGRREVCATTEQVSLGRIEARCVSTGGRFDIYGAKTKLDLPGSCSHCHNSASLDMQILLRVFLLSIDRLQCVAELLANSSRGTTMRLSLEGVSLQG